METKELKNGLSIIELEERHEMAVAPTVQIQPTNPNALAKCDNRCTSNTVQIPKSWIKNLL